MSLRNLVASLWILLGLAMISGAIAFTAWQFGASLRETGAVVLIVYIPVAVLCLAAFLIGGAWGRRLWKAGRPDSTTTQTDPAETERRAGPD